MGCAIESVVIGGVSEKRCVIDQTDFARLIGIGNAWSKVRLVARIALSDSGDDLVADQKFWFGVMHDPSDEMDNGPWSDWTSHFVGMRSGELTWSRLTSPTRYYVAPDSAMLAVKRVLDTNVESNMSPSQHLGIYFSADPAAMRWPVFVEIVKGTPNFTVQGVWPAENSALTFDLTSAQMFSALQLSTMLDVATELTNLSGMTYLCSSAIELAVDEATDGALNAVCISWQTGENSMHISDIFGFPTPPP